MLHSRSVIRSVWLFPYKVVLLQVSSCHENYSSYDTDYSVKMNRIDSVTAESGEITLLSSHVGGESKRLRSRAAWQSFNFKNAKIVRLQRSVS